MANRFWVGGTGTWDSSDTTHWSTLSGSSGGASVPGSGDAVIFDGSSGGGTVTLNFGGTITIQSLTTGAFTGTWDNSVNNNNITLTNTGNAMDGSGTGTRTIKLGSATYTLSGNGARWRFTTVTNLTYQGGSTATIAFTGTSGTRGVDTPSGFSSTVVGNVTVAGCTSSAERFLMNVNNTVANKYQTFTVTGPNNVEVTNATCTIVGALTATGTSSGLVLFTPQAFTSSATLALGAASTGDWCGFKEITFTTSSMTATNSFDISGNSGLTATAPTPAGLMGRHPRLNGGLV